MLSRIGIGSRSKLFPGPCSEIVTRINHIAGEGRFMNSQYLKVGPWIRCQSTGVETGRQTQPLKSTIVEEDGEPFRDFNDAGSVTGLDKEKETEEEFQIKMKLLDASLNYVNTMGWSTQALKAGTFFGLGFYSSCMYSLIIIMTIMFVFKSRCCRFKSF